MVFIALYNFQAATNSMQAVCNLALKQNLQLFPIPGNGCGKCEEAGAHIIRHWLAQQLDALNQVLPVVLRTQMDKLVLCTQVFRSLVGVIYLKIK